MLEDIQQLRVFVQIVQSGSMTAAARALELQPNTVSRRIASLEDAVGRALLVRTTRRVELSDEGRRFLEHARAILSTVQAAEEDLQAGTGLRGRLRLGLSTRTASPALLNRLAGLMRENPELSISVEVADEPYDIVGAGVDLAVVGGPQPDSSLVAAKLFDLYSGLVAHEDYLAHAGVPRRREELKHHECLLFRGRGQADLWRLTDSRGHEHDVRVGGRFSSNNSRVLLDAVAAGLGIGLLELPVPKNRARRDMVRVLPSYRFGPLPVYAVMPKGVATTTPVRVVLQLLRDQLREGLAPPVEA